MASLEYTTILSNSPLKSIISRSVWFFPNRGGIFLDRPIKGSAACNPLSLVGYIVALFSPLTIIPRNSKATIDEICLPQISPSNNSVLFLYLYEIICVSKNSNQTTPSLLSFWGIYGYYITLMIKNIAGFILFIFQSSFSQQ